MSLFGCALLRAAPRTRARRTSKRGRLEQRQPQQAACGQRDGGGGAGHLFLRISCKRVSRLRISRVRQVKTMPTHERSSGLALARRWPRFAPPRIPGRKRAPYLQRQAGDSVSPIAWRHIFAICGAQPAAPARLSISILAKTYDTRRMDSMDDDGRGGKATTTMAVEGVSGGANCKPSQPQRRPQSPGTIIGAAL